MIDMTERGKKIRLADSLDFLANDMTLAAGEMERLYTPPHSACDRAKEMHGAAKMAHDWADAIREDAEKCTK